MNKLRRLFKLESNIEALTYTLSVDSGEGKQRVTLSPDHPLTIGCSADCALVLEESQASATHARLHFKSDHWILTDLDSEQGTFVDQHRIYRIPLQVSQSFRIGTTTFSLEAEPIGPDHHATPDLSPTAKRPVWFRPAIAAGIILLAVGGLRLWTKDKDSPQPLAVPAHATETTTHSNITSTVAPSTSSPESTSLNNINETNRKAAREHYRMGLLHYDGGYLSRAIAEWDQALALDPSHSLALKKLTRAVRELDEAIDLHYRQGKQHMKYMRLDDARREFTIVTELTQDEQDERYLDARQQLNTLHDSQ